MASKKNAAAVVADPENDGRVDEVEETTALTVEVEGGELSENVDWGSYGDEHKANAVKLKASEVIIPMLKIVQEQSKIYKNQDRNNPVCELGDIYNSVTGQVYKAKDGVLVVPFDCTDCVIERKPAPSGEFIAKLKTNDPRVQQAFKDNGDDGWKKLTSKQKTQLVYTEEVPVGLVDPTNPEVVYGVALVPFSGTNVFPRRLWWNNMATAPGAKDTPRYAFRSVLKTKLRKAAQAGGVDSYKFDVEPYINPKSPRGHEWSTCRFRPGHPTLQGCLEFLTAYKSGVLGKADYQDADATDSESAAEASILDDKGPAF